MIPVPSHIDRGRALILFIILYVLFIVAGMMTIGALNLPAETYRWVKIIVGVGCFFLAYGITQAAVKKGKPAWLVKK